MRGLHRASASGLWLAVAVALCSPPAVGETVARWVDDDGITHFGNLQFAPNDATRIATVPTNGMVAPTEIPRSTAARGPVWTVIDRAPRQNKVGWRSKGEGPTNGHISPRQR